VPRLRRSDCASPGIARRRRGRGFEYLDPDGERVDDPETLERIAALTIPPAWREVWICLDARGHLQATGFDAASRKQYLYHERWRAHRDRAKFDSMIAFGESLPGLRRKVSRDLGGARGASGDLTGGDLTGEGLTRERVLACAVRLLDLGFFRIGSEGYAERNESYGLASMLKRHVSVKRDELLFDYPAKSGQRRVQAIADPQAREIVAALKRRRGGGEELLACRVDGRWSNVGSDDVNAYVKAVSGGEFTAKDFRTWNATVLAAVALALAENGREANAVNGGRAQSKTARERAVSDAVKTVASYLGNTPAVCRASYVDPRVIDRYRSGSTILQALGKATEGPDLGDARTRTRIEAAVLELLAEG
jgi:DNA topoisomerase IB